MWKPKISRMDNQVWEPAKPSERSDQHLLQTPYHAIIIAPLVLFTLPSVKNVFIIETSLVYLEYINFRETKYVTQQNFNIFGK